MEKGVNLAGFYTTINGTEILKKKINNFPRNIALKNLAKEKLQAEILSEILFFSNWWFIKKLNRCAGVRFL